MNRLRVIILLLFSFCIKIGAQSHDASWVMGSYSDSTGTLMHFNSDGSLEMDTIPIPFHYLLTRSSFSNSEGSLLLFSNGCAIANDKGEIITDINVFEESELFCISNGMDMPNGVIFLDHQENDSIVSAFYLSKGIYSGDPAVLILDLRQTTIRINSTPSNPYEIVVHDRVVSSETFANGYLTAVRHGNGRDWWIFQPEMLSNSITTLLISEGEKVLEFKQDPGPSLTTHWFLSGSVISPNGKYLVYGNQVDGCFIQQIDRCDGSLTFLDTLQIKYHSDSVGRFGLAFSPNNKYLYVAYPYHVYRFDMEAPDIDLSRKIISTYDGFADPFPAYFSFMELAPNGKIYLATGNAGRHLHVIDSPNLPDADVSQRSIILKNDNDFGIPHFPNYGIGPSKGSPCDTLTLINDPNPETSISIGAYPNPFKNTVFIEPSEENLEFKIIIYDLMGRIIRKQTINEYTSKFSLDLSTLSPGMYPYVLSSLDGRILGSGKLVKIN